MSKLGSYLHSRSSLVIVRVIGITIGSGGSYDGHVAELTVSRWLVLSIVRLECNGTSS
jgi:hypothetical protein